MHRLKQATAFVLAMMLLVSANAMIAVGAPSAPAAGFPDMAGHWAAATVQAAAQAGLVNGYPDGSFRPDEAVTRAQFIKLMIQVRGLAPKPGTGGFTGLQAHWLAEQGYIQPAVDAGLVVPADYGEPPELQPDQHMARQEAAIFAVRAMNRLGAALTLHGAPLPYKDEVPDWTTGYVAAAHSAGVMQGNPDLSFGAGKSLTRAEAAAIALRVLDASKLTQVPLWEANSWAVATLPTTARQVAAAPDGTLYWIQDGLGQVWRQRPLKQAEPIATVENYLLGPIAAGPGGLYLAQGARILQVSPEGQISQLAGGPEPGYKNGPAPSALFQSIQGLCSDDQGNLYVTEGYDPGRVRKIAPGGDVATLAGLTPRQEAAVEFGGVMYGKSVDLNSGVTGPSYLVRINHPTLCAAGPGGSLYVVVEGGNIQKISPDGQVSWVAGGSWGSDGSVAEAGLGTIRSLAADHWGNLWVLDGFNRVRRITPDGHVYTVAGGGGTAQRIKFRDSEYPRFVTEARQVDGPGPDARFEAPDSLALVGGELYVADQSKLRKVTGHTGWYPAEKAVQLQPATDDPGFWAMSGGNFRPGPARLSVALYAPAEAVGLKVDGEQVAESHHPLYTLRWDAQPGAHRLTALIRWPDGRWAEGASRETQVTPDGAITDRAMLISPRPRSWLTGTVALQATSYWQEAKLAVDGRVVARGSGLIAAAWDTTQVVDGFHQITLTVGDAQPSFIEVYVGNGGFPPQEPEGDGFVAYFFGRRYTYSGRALPREIDGIPVLPFHETAHALGFETAWDPQAHLLTATRGDQRATLQVETRETTGLKWPQIPAKVVPEGDEFLVDWLFFTTLAGAQGRADMPNQTLVFRPE